MNLKELREEIDLIDNKLIGLLAQRFSITELVGEYKKENGINTSLDKNRFKEILDDKIEKGNELGLDEDFIKKIWNTIHDYSRKQQEKIIL